jgi:23S rRNA pseudouridine1911/1915/1917 synthase
MAERFDAEEGVRLDVFLTRQLDGATRGYVQKLIERGQVKVAGKVRQAGYRLRAGELVTLEQPALPAGPEPKILLEKDGLLLLEKPVGLIVHPAGESWLHNPETALNEPEPSLVSWLLRRNPKAAQLPRCGLVHRLDRETSGVMAASTDSAVQEELLAQFRGRSVEKVYLAVVDGKLPKPQGSIEAPVGRVGPKLKATPYGRPAQSLYKVLKEGAGKSLVEVRPVTGRTHQIRVHLSVIGNPVLGDLEHGGRAADRLYLHAHRLKLSLGGEAVEGVSPAPPEFLKLT